MFTVPPVTRSPGAFSAGIGSPVTIDSSIALCPSITMPSTGTFSPGRTRQVSPTRTSRIGTSRSSPSRTTLAVLGVRPNNCLSARLRARSSSTWPSRTNAVMTTAVSK